MNAPDPTHSLFEEALGDAPGRGRLEGRRILVVGGGQRATGDNDTQGNGRAIARLAAREGAYVAVADKDRQAAAGTVLYIRATGGRADPIVADVAIPAEVERMVAEAHRAMGGLDGIVLNVGISGLPGGLGGQDADAWDGVFAVNVRAHMLTCKAAFPLLADGSAIVLVSSVASIRPGSMKPAYDTSKAALEGLGRHIAMEGEPRGVRCNVLALGMVDTPMGRAASAGNPGRAARWTPFGRQATGWETAYAALFLLSHESSYVNGHFMVMDGGRTTIRNT